MTEYLHTDHPLVHVVPLISRN